MFDEVDSDRIFRDLGLQSGDRSLRSSPFSGTLASNRHLQKGSTGTKLLVGLDTSGPLAQCAQSDPWGNHHPTMLI